MGICGGSGSKKQGAITVAITSISHTTNVTYRNSNGLNLYQVCDCVLDNGGIVGDAAVILDGLPQKIAPTTSVIDISFWRKFHTIYYSVTSH